MQQRAQDRQYLEVAFQGDRIEIETKLGQLSFVQDFKQIQSLDETASSYEVVSEKGHQTCDELSRMAYENQWSLVSLQPKAVDLEDIFLQLTRSETQLEGVSS